MYACNTDAQMSKIHSYYGSFACCQLLSVELFHDCRATLFFGEPKTNASTFYMLRLWWTFNSQMLYRWFCTSVGQVAMYQCSKAQDMIMVQSHGFPMVTCRRDHWCCIILAPLIISLRYPQAKTQSTRTGTQVLLSNAQKYLHCFGYKVQLMQKKLCKCMQPSLQCSCTHQ